MSGQIVEIRRVNLESASAVLANRRYMLWKRPYKGACGRGLALSGAAIAGGWVAIEALLSEPSDRVGAAERLAMLLGTCTASVLARMSQTSVGIPRSP